MASPGERSRPGVAQSAQLQGKAETVVWSASMTDVFEVVLGQGVMLEQGGLVGRQRQQRAALALGEDVASWHRISSRLNISLF